MSTLPLTKDCFVSPLALVSLRKFGLESLEWEPEVLRDAFEQQFEIKKMPQKMFDKLNCGYMLVGTNAFEATIEGFLSATAIMNNLVFDESAPPYCSLDMCAWSVFEYLQLLGELKDGEATCQFSPDIVKYIQEVGKVNGIYTFPKWLSFANYPDDEIPDLSADPDQFSQFQLLQQDYVSGMNAFVTEKNELLKNELLDCQKVGLLG